MNLNLNSIPQVERKCWKKCYGGKCQNLDSQNLYPKFCVQRASHYLTEHNNTIIINVIICLFMGSILMLINISKGVLSIQCLLSAEDKE